MPVSAAAGCALADQLMVERRSSAWRVLTWSAVVARRVPVMPLGTRDQPWWRGVPGALGPVVWAAWRGVRWPV